MTPVFANPCAGVVCSTASQCKTAGSCAGGACSAPTNKPAGTSCNTYLGSLAGNCDGAGACGVPCTGVTCTGDEACFTCGPTTGLCDVPRAPNADCEIDVPGDGTCSCEHVCVSKCASVTCGSCQACDATSGLCATTAGADCDLVETNDGTCDAAAECISKCPLVSVCAACQACVSATGACATDPSQAGQACTPAGDCTVAGTGTCASGVCSGATNEPQGTACNTYLGSSAGNCDGAGACDVPPCAGVTCTGDEACFTCGPATGLCDVPRATNADCEIDVPGDGTCSCEDVCVSKCASVTCTNSNECKTCGPTTGLCDTNKSNNTPCTLDVRRRALLTTCPVGRRRGLLAISGPTCLDGTCCPVAT
jgi:hypothetical protein